MKLFRIYVRAFTHMDYDGHLVLVVEARGRWTRKIIARQRVGLSVDWRWL